MIRHSELAAKGDAYLELAWMAAEASERRAREAAGQAYEDAAARRRRAARPVVSVLLVVSGERQAAGQAYESAVWSVAASGLPGCVSQDMAVSR